MEAQRDNSGATRMSITLADGLRDAREREALRLWRARQARLGAEARERRRARAQIGPPRFVGPS